MEKLRFVEFSLVLIVFLLTVFLFLEVRLSGFAIDSQNLILSSNDFLSEDNILVYPDKIVIKISNASIQNYADTKSMVPIITYNTNGIVVLPKSEDELRVGDIISFRHKENEFVHRIVEISEDEQGIYFITKGDNSNVYDDKVRFEEITGLVVGLIY
jgi:hypothetical protein